MSGVAGARTAAGICQEMSVMEHYEVCEVLGEGTSGTVHRLQRRKTTTPSLTYSDNVSTNVEGEVFAGKRLDASSEQNVKDFYVEVQRLLDFSSESTIEVYGSYLFEGEAWIVLEYCGGGSLFDLLCAIGRPFSEEVVQLIVAYVLIGLDTLHTHKFAHQDIKAGNLLVTSAGHVKLCDFGVVEGTLHWMAPELLDTSGKKQHGDALLPCDVWSLGITIVELSTGSTPHAQVVNKTKVIQSILRSPSPTLPKDSFSTDMIDFLKNCLEKKPSSRSTVQKLMQHKWIGNSIKQIKNQRSNPEHVNLLANVLNNMANICRERESELEVFKKNQAFEQFCRLEAEREELAREEMDEMDHEMHVFLINEQEAIKKAQRQKIRLDKEAQVAKEVALRKAEQKEKECEEKERGMMSSEDDFSKLDNDEAFAVSNLKWEGELLKQSDKIGSWNSRYFFIDKSLIIYFHSINDTTERDRYLITANTRVRISSTNQNIIELVNEEPHYWKLRLNCDSDTVDAQVWLARFKRCVDYVEKLQSIHIQRRVTILEKRILIMGWLKKVSEYLGILNTRYFILSKGILTYYDVKEKCGCTRFRGQYKFSAATTVTKSTDNPDIVLVEDKILAWSISFEVDPELPIDKDSKKYSADDWISFIRAHVALVS